MQINAKKRLEADELIESDIIVPDTVQMNVPLFLRLMELSKESIKTDAQLHELLERLLDSQSKHDVLTMNQYDFIKGDIDDSEEY